MNLCLLTSTPCSLCSSSSVLFMNHVSYDAMSTPPCTAIVHSRFASITLSQGLVDGLILVSVMFFQTALFPSAPQWTLSFNWKRDTPRSFENQLGSCVIHTLDARLQHGSFCLNNLHAWITRSWQVEPSKLLPPTLWNTLYNANAICIIWRLPLSTWEGITMISVLTQFWGLLS